MSDMQFYCGNESDKWRFCRLPKMLLEEERYEQLSTEAKFLYTLLVDRVGLSIRNGWKDKNDRIYVYFTLEEGMKRLHCGRNKIVRIFKELDSKHGVGLIERKLQGQGNPAKIFVGIPASKALSASTERSAAQSHASTAQPKPSAQTAQPKPSAQTAQPKPSAPPTQRAKENQGYSGIGKATSATPKVQNQEFRAEDTDRSFSDLDGMCVVDGISKTKVLPRDDQDDPDRGMDLEITQEKIAEVNMLRKIQGLQPYNPPDFVNSKKPHTRIASLQEQQERGKLWDRCREKIKLNIEYDRLLTMNHAPCFIEKEQVDMIVTVMTEVCCSRTEFFTINSIRVPTSELRSKFLQIDTNTVEDVIYSLQRRENGTIEEKIRNMRAYLITTLYNATEPSMYEPFADY